MTSTPEEFVGSLTAAFPAALETALNTLIVSHGMARVRFDYQVAPSWRIGSLRLPSLLVGITVLDGDPEAVNTLIDRVDRATQRGGG
jgi:hypothetical protein